MNKECLQALNNNLQCLTCSSKHLSTSIVPMDLLGLLRWYELKDHGWEISGPKPELFAGEWWESLCSKVSNYAMLIGRGGRGLGKKKKACYPYFKKECDFSGWTGTLYHLSETHAVSHIKYACHIWLSRLLKQKGFDNTQLLKLNVLIHNTFCLQLQYRCWNIYYRNH